MCFSTCVKEHERTKLVYLGLPTTVQDCLEHIQMFIIRRGLGQGCGRVYRVSPEQSPAILDQNGDIFMLYLLNFWASIRWDIKIVPTHDDDVKRS